MNFLYRPYTLRRYGQPVSSGGYAVFPFTDITKMMDIQTTENRARTDADGTESMQRLKVFCDEELFVDNAGTQQRADQVWFQNKWFRCRASRLSDNTPLRHWTSEFVECLDQDDPPGIEQGVSE